MPEKEQSSTVVVGISYFLFLAWFIAWMVSAGVIVLLFVPWTQHCGKTCSIRGLMRSGVCSAVTVEDGEGDIWPMGQAVADRGSWIEKIREIL